MDRGIELNNPSPRANSTGDLDSLYNRGFGAPAAIANRRLEILDWISPSVPWERHEDISNDRVDGVGQWLLQTDEFVKWRYGEDDVTDQVLFCCGNAGVGKTYLSSLLVDILRGGIDENEIVSGVYCDFYTHGNQAIAHLLGILLKQVLSDLGRVPTEIHEEFDRAKERLDGGVARLPELLNMLIDTLSSVPRAYLCIDALDEFPAEHRQKLFRALRRVIEDSPGIRLFLTGRPSIRDEVKNRFAGGVQVRPIEAPREDIERFLRMKLAQDKHPEAMNEDLETDIIGIAPKAASETFLLASFKIDAILARDTITSRREMLEKMANYWCVGAVYTALLNQVMKSGGHVRALMEVLLWISHSERPMKVSELCDALHTELGSVMFGIDPGSLTNLVLSCSQGLVKLDKRASTFRLKHSTLRNHFRKYFAMFDKAHSKIAGVCLTYLNWMVSNRIHRDTPLGQYASLYWVTHYRQQTTDSVQSLVLKLLTNSRDTPQYSLYPLRKKGVWPELYRQPSYTIGHTVLHYIALLGIDDLAGEFLGDKSWIWEVNRTDSYGSTPLIWASRYGNDRAVWLLLQIKEIKPDLPDFLFHRTPLSWAAERGHELIVKLLLAQDSVDPNTQCEQGQTPLLWAVKCRKERVVKLLLENAKVDPNSANDVQRRTPLFWAVKGGHRRMIKLLLDNKKVNPNIPEDYTPLHWAAEHDDEEGVKLLLGREDIKPNIVGGDHQTPLALAAHKGNGGVVKLLLEREDVDRNTFDDRGRTPLICAIAHNHRDVVKLLLGAGHVNVNWGDKNGLTPLHWSADLGNEGIVRLLLKQKNIDADSPDIFGQTPLSRAAENGRRGVVKVLLRVREVNHCSSDDGGRTPLEWARLRGHESVVRLLRGCEGVAPGSRCEIIREPPSDTFGCSGQTSGQGVWCDTLGMATPLWQLGSGNRAALTPRAARPQDCTNHPLPKGQLERPPRFETEESRQHGQPFRTPEIPAGQEKVTSEPEGDGQQEETPNSFRFLGLIGREIMSLQKNFF